MIFWIGGRLPGVLFRRREQRLLAQQSAHAVGSDFGGGMQPAEGAHAGKAAGQDVLEKACHELQRVDYGIPGGDSSMARTVGLPAAAGARLVLEGRIGSRGVLVPVIPEIYGPILAELRAQGIVFHEERTSV